MSRFCFRGTTPDHLPFVGVTISRATFRRQIFRADQKAEGGQEGSGGGWGGKRIAREPPPATWPVRSNRIPVLKPQPSMNVVMSANAIFAQLLGRGAESPSVTWTWLEARETKVGQSCVRAAFL